MANIVTRTFSRVGRVFGIIPRFISRHPILSFILAMLVLFGLIVLGNIAFKPKTVEITKTPQVKSVKTFAIGSAPKIMVNAQIEKSGQVKILAQTAGIINQINVKTGDQVKKGSNLIQLASTYDGANQGALQLALAAKQYQITKDTFDTQKELIQKQREVAEKSATNANDMRDIANRSLQETRDVIDVNQGVLDLLNDDFKRLEASGAANAGPAQRAEFEQVRQFQAQVSSGLLQLRSGLRSAELQANPSGSPAQLADLQKQIALKQLDVQEKTLSISKDIGRLQVSLANIGAALYHPTAPFAGTVERIFVRPNQTVQPGMPLLIITGGDQSANAIAKVPQAIAQNITSTDQSNLIIEDKSYPLPPPFVSTTETDGNLYSLIFDIPTDLVNLLTDSSYVRIEVPAGLPDTTEAVPFVPLDSVYQTQDKAFLYVVDGDKAKGKQVKLGQVLGEFVQINEGLESGDQVIVNRNVIEGDQVKSE